MLQNVTISAEESVIASVREFARQDDTTLNALIRGWMEDYARRKSRVEGEERVRKYRECMARLKHVKLGRMPTREERNAR